MRGKTKIAMCVIYGKQESVSTVEDEEQFQDLTTQINLYQKTHKVIVLGDLARVSSPRSALKILISTDGVHN